MHQFGHTRGARHPDHLLQTPDTFVRAPLPGMQKATAIIHVAPAAGARFTEYTVEFESGGRLQAPSASNASLTFSKDSYKPANPRSDLAILRTCRRKRDRVGGGSSGPRSGDRKTISIANRRPGSSLSHWPRGVDCGRTVIRGPSARSANAPPE